MRKLALAARRAPGQANLRLKPALPGVVLFRGQSVERASLSQLQREATVVLQDPVSSLSPRRSVRQLIRLPFDNDGPSNRDLKVEVLRLLALVVLPAHMVNRNQHQFSGGQAQRVALTRAVARRHLGTDLIGQIVIQKTHAHALGLPVLGTPGPFKAIGDVPCVRCRI